jgi:hypothetical protein
MFLPKCVPVQQPAGFPAVAEEGDGAADDESNPSRQTDEQAGIANKKGRRKK